MYEEGNSLRFYHNGAGTGVTNGTSTLNQNQWYHIVATYDGSNTYVYVNGVQDGTAVVTGAINTNNDNLYIGYNTGANNYDFNGSIDDVMVFNRGLTAFEVRRLYEDGSKNYGHFNDVIVTDDLTVGGNVGIGDTSPDASLERKIQVIAVSVSE